VSSPSVVENQIRVEMDFGKSLVEPVDEPLATDGVSSAILAGLPFKIGARPSRATEQQGVLVGASRALGDFPI